MQFNIYITRYWYFDKYKWQTVLKIEKSWRIKLDFIRKKPKIVLFKFSFKMKDVILNLLEWVL